MISNLKCVLMQVRLCREKSTGHVYAMKKLKKSEMLRRGQVVISIYHKKSWQFSQMICGLTAIAYSCSVCLGGTC